MIHCDTFKNRTQVRNSCDKKNTLFCNTIYKKTSADRIVGEGGIIYLMFELNESLNVCCILFGYKVMTWI